MHLLVSPSTNSTLFRVIIIIIAIIQTTGTDDDVLSFV